MTRKTKQLALAIRERPTHGGKRKGAGRKRAPDVRPTPPHRSREPMSRRAPLHVTMRVAPAIYNLRSKRSLRVIDASLRAGAARFGVLVVQTSVQGNHLHFLVEADDPAQLGRAMKGLAIRMARGLNKMMCRSGGQVFTERYHARALGSPTEVRNVVRYLRDNRRHHLGDHAALLPASFVDPYTSEGRCSPAFCRPPRCGCCAAAGGARRPAGDCSDGHDPERPAQPTLRGRLAPSAAPTPTAPCTAAAVSSRSAEGSTVLSRA